MEPIAEQLRDNLDLDVELKSVEFADYLQRLAGGEVTGPYRLGWIADRASAQNYLQPLLYSTATSNYTGWSQQQFDSQIDEGNAARSVAAGLDSYAQAEDIAIGDMPLIPLFFHRNAVVHSEQVSNVQLNHAGLVNWADVTVDDPASVLSVYFAE
jgi:ABC-type oligopeptide transport system substrate-binding subunit